MPANPAHHLLNARCGGCSRGHLHNGVRDQREALMAGSATSSTMADGYGIQVVVVRIGSGAAAGQSSQAGPAMPTGQR